jgi:hypothetical protein
MAECDDPFHLTDVTSPSTLEETLPNSGVCFLTWLADREDLADPFDPRTIPSGCQSFRGEIHHSQWTWGTLPAISAAVLPLPLKQAKQETRNFHQIPWNFVWINAL